MFFALTNLQVLKDDNLLEYSTKFELSYSTNTFTSDSCIGSFIYQACVEINKCISSEDVIFTKDVGITTPVSSNDPECIDASITTIFNADLVDLQVAKIFEPLPSIV